MQSIPEYVNASGHTQQCLTDVFDAGRICRSCQTACPVLHSVNTVS